MAENSSIEWTTHTFNCWIGCTRVSPGCQHCYAETQNGYRKWTGGWGPKAARTRTSEAYWKQPIAWNSAAAKAGVRARVFCCSLADVFDDHPSIHPDWRRDLYNLIDSTPHLDWQLLTKRPENVATMVPLRWMTQGFPPNVWLGTSVEDQRRAFERIPALLNIPARVRFLSCEPLLDHVDLDHVGEWRGIALSALEEIVGYIERPAVDWVIVGGESGPGARPLNVQWVRDIVRQCRAAGVAVFVKQLGAHPVEPIPGRVITRTVNPDFMGGGWAHLQLRSAKGGDMTEWPADLRVREFPAVRA